MKIFITGGAGFIGSHVVDKLLDRGDSVVCIDNFNDYYNPKFKKQNVEEHIKHTNYKLIKGDITDQKLLDDIFLKNTFEKIVHVAARAGVRPSIENPFIYQKTNIEGTLRIFDMAKRYKISHVVYASSSSVYGNQEKIPFSETDPIETPISPYAATKKTCELLAFTYYHLYKINCTGLRFFTVYGERGRPDMAPYMFTERILKGIPIKKFGDGNTQRDYTYIEDIVDGVLKSIDKPLGYEIINLGNSNAVSLNGFIKIIEEKTGKKAIIENYPMQPGDVPITFADVNKAKKLLGWEPKTHISTGMNKFIAWYKKNRL